VIRFHVIGMTKDRRTPELRERLRVAEQEAADLAIEREWRRRVRENERRQLLARRAARG
jgi:hypothetical protein